MVCLRAKTSHKTQGICFKQINTQSDQTGYNYCLILCFGLAEAWLGSDLLAAWTEMLVLCVMFHSFGSTHSRRTCQHGSLSVHWVEVMGWGKIYQEASRLGGQPGSGRGHGRLAGKGPGRSRRVTDCASSLVVCAMDLIHGLPLLSCLRCVRDGLVSWLANVQLHALWT